MGQHQRGTLSSDVTDLLTAYAAGDEAALGELFEAIYRELRALARSLRHRMRASPTLDSVALVNECYLKLLKGAGQRTVDRDHFFAVAASAMRHLMVDYARAKATAKRQGERAEVDPDDLAVAQQAEEVLAVHQALDRLASFDARLVTITECRYFAGMSVPETAAAVGVSVSTVERSWRAAQAFIARELEP
jgi:RNA polymerase sigma factor (TIGR02999 family)